MSASDLTYASLSRVGVFKREDGYVIVDFDTQKNEWVEAPINLASYSGTPEQTLNTLTTDMLRRRSTLKATITRRGNKRS